MGKKEQVPALAIFVQGSGTLPLLLYYFLKLSMKLVNTIRIQFISHQSSSSLRVPRSCQLALLAQWATQQLYAAAVTAVPCEAGEPAGEPAMQERSMHQRGPAPSGR